MAICLFLSVLLAVSGLAAGTAGDLGEVCTANKACTPTSAVCDSATTHCKTKAGESCAGPASSSCVSLSTCDTTSTKCTCNDGYTATPAGLCTAIAQGKVNAACNGTKVCTGTNVNCTGGYCTCKAGFSGNKGDDDCTATFQGKINAVCDGTKVCTGTNVVCKDGICTCKAGFSGDKGDDHCTSNKGIALGQVSLWTLCMTIMTMSLAVNVV